MTDSASITRPVREQMIRRQGQASLLSYIRSCDPNFVVDPIHRLLCDQLEQAYARKVDRLIINVHPRLGKSRAVAIEFPSWVIGKDFVAKKAEQPSFLVAGHSAHLSTDHSLEARNRTRHAMHRIIFPGAELLTKRADAWSIAGGGKYFAAGVGGTIVGRGCSYLLVDDAHASFEEAHSLTLREKVWNWFLSDAMSRLTADGVIIIIATRWHPDDLIGRLLSKDRQKELESSGANVKPWTVISLPALAEDNDPMGRQPGEALSPSRWPANVLRERMAMAGDYISAAEFQQRPRTLGAGHIKTDRMNIVDAGSVPKDLRWVRFWDLACTEKTMSDYTAGPKMAMDGQGRMWIADMRRGQWKWPVARDIIRNTAAGEANVMVGVEAWGLGDGLFQNLMEDAPSGRLIRKYEPDRDKLSRANGWIALCDAGKIMLVRDGNWVPAFIGECASFPDPGSHDDQVDAVSGGYLMLVTKLPEVFQRKLVA